MDKDWIPVSSELPPEPDYSEIYWVTVQPTGFPEARTTRKARWMGTRDGRWVGKETGWLWPNGHPLGHSWEVIAWMPYKVPEPYQERKG